MKKKLVVLLILFVISPVLLANSERKPPLVERIIKVESSYNPKVVSKKGAIGLMQVRYSVWHRDLKKAGIIKSRKCLFNPQVNIKAGTYILNHYLKLCSKNLECALQKYSGNAKNYYKKVMR